MFSQSKYTPSLLESPGGSSFTLTLSPIGGCPGVADPGSQLIRLAHSAGIRVIPQVGPASMILALMASGMSGQNFKFNGYLPIEKNERKSKIKK